MSLFLDPTGEATYGIAICARCSRKFLLAELQSDPNYPGLKVCRVDLDEYDPYRLPARQPEKISLRFARPDTPIGTDPLGLPTEDDNYFLITEDSEDYLEP